MIGIPVDVGAYVGSVLAVALFAMLLTEWLKKFVASDLLVNVLTLVLALALSFVATGIQSQWNFFGPELFTAFMVGFFGATVAVFGYEVFKNAKEVIEQIAGLFGGGA